MVGKAALLTYLKVFVDFEFGVLGVFVELQQVLPLLCETTWEEIRKESLNGTKDKNVSNGGERNQ